MLFNGPLPKQDSLRQAIDSAYRRNETQCIETLLQQPLFSAAALMRIQDTAQQLAIKARQEYQHQNITQKILHQYDLSTEEGIALMCLAEALLRIPDKYTRDLLISNKISTIDWLKSNQKNSPLFMNAASWSLLLTGKIFSPAKEQEHSFFSVLKRSLSSPGIATLRPFIQQAMKMIGNQFVAGQTIIEALQQTKNLQKHGYRFSFDMLGEAARTTEDAKIYFESYKNALTIIGHNSTHDHLIYNPSISIKLSALHPRYEYAQQERVIRELIPLLFELIYLAQQYHVGITIDAEEADRLDLSLNIFALLFSNKALTSWEGLGLAVQAYQKRASYVIDWLIALSQQHQRRIMVRLVKGAYWDSEIKQSQVLGLTDYPVFTRKYSTDLSYSVCAKKLLTHLDCFYPQFGTHNAYSIATILEMLPKNATADNFEFQCLHGMGEPLYNIIVDKNQYNLPVRIYAPVGSHQDLISYLIRRLLENGANTSFIKHLNDPKIPLETIITDPVKSIISWPSKPHPFIPLPRHIYKDRENSQGIDLTHYQELVHLQLTLEKISQQSWSAAPLIHGKHLQHESPHTILSPANLHDIVGQVYLATANDTKKALQIATQAQKSWAEISYTQRALYLEQAADLFQQQQHELIALLCREGGKTIPDSITEIRETIDYCRYYAIQARKDLLPQPLQGPTGELNQLSLHPRGLIICISPWNFPLAIFTGQILAALVTGNVVIAKPAEQTPLIAAKAVALLHQAGIPHHVLQLLPGKGAVIGTQLVADHRIAGVMFTGSTETAANINQILAKKAGPIVPLIAETGGQNAMIVDASALCEQVVIDVIQSAFNSAGQRCSALRVLFIQQDIAPRLLPMLKGAMAELRIGHPALLATDIGPVINHAALENLQKHVEKLKNAQDAELLYQLALPPTLHGHYFAPCAFILKDLSLLPREVFGPILHILTYPADALDKVIDTIHQTGYGLTLGIHSRIDSTIAYIKKHAAVGNIYVNRNIIGAVVGVQPFGGERLSGTGPKAGGPYYLPRLCIERTVSTNTTAVGGNTTLITLLENENAAT